MPGVGDSSDVEMGRDVEVKDLATAGDVQSAVVVDGNVEELVRSSFDLESSRESLAVPVQLLVWVEFLLKVRDGVVEIPSVELEVTRSPVLLVQFSVEHSIVQSPVGCASDEVHGQQSL